MSYFLLSTILLHCYIDHHPILTDINTLFTNDTHISHPSISSTTTTTTITTTIVIVIGCITIVTPFTTN